MKTTGSGKGSLTWPWGLIAIVPASSWGYGAGNDAELAGLHWPRRASPKGTPVVAETPRYDAQNLAIHQSRWHQKDDLI